VVSKRRRRGGGGGGDTQCGAQAHGGAGGKEKAT